MLFIYILFLCAHLCEHSRAYISFWMKLFILTLIHAGMGSLTQIRYETIVSLTVENNPLQCRKEFAIRRCVDPRTRPISPHMHICTYAHAHKHIYTTHSNSIFNHDTGKHPLHAICQYVHSHSNKHLHITHLVQRDVT